MTDVAFAIVFFASILSACFFGERALETYHPLDIAGFLFGLSLMLVSALILPEL